MRSRVHITPHSSDWLWRLAVGTVLALGAAAIIAAIAGWK